jgi:hypothetical protein
MKNVVIKISGKYYQNKSEKFPTIMKKYFE